ncbi:hypothetical protein B566_EDAN008977 [Ephemera danica]|nr:hypothetical protein B566_EDAN008977 [Ephemera danica]
MMQQLFSALPDDRPITSIGIIEDPEKCPPDYYVVSRTHDQDSDADLWKDGFFGRKVTRYLCLSKKTGLPDYIVESIAVVSDKEIPPDGYTLLPRTIDSEQKAWRKRQLCYRLSRRSLAACSVTDVIVLSRMKKAPDGFSLAGEINGLTLCFKTGPKPTASINNTAAVSSPLPSPLGYSLNPATPVTPVPRKSSSSSNGTAYPMLSSPAGTEEGDDYVCLRPVRQAPPLPPVASPLRAAPVRQLSLAASASRNYATLAAFQGLEGVPFELSPKLRTMVDPTSINLPSIRPWSEYQIEQEFQYDFRTERQAMAS